MENSPSKDVTKGYVLKLIFGRLVRVNVVFLIGRIYALLSPAEARLANLKLLGF